jgi:hypothetical protein
MDTCTTLVALVLAVVAAITSAPGRVDMPRQLSVWVQLGSGPEADATAGAIGEYPIQAVPP